MGGSPGVKQSPLPTTSLYRFMDLFTSLTDLWRDLCRKEERDRQGKTSFLIDPCQSLIRNAYKNISQIEIEGFYNIWYMY